MAHMVETMVSTQKEWHHYLTGHAIAENPMTAEEALQKAGLDWEVEKRQLFYAGRDGTPIMLKGKFANTRITDDRAFGSVSSDYRCFQNRTLLESVMHLAEDTGVFRFQTAGALNGGKTVFCLGAFTRKYDVITGDEHKAFLFATLDHSGTESVRFFWTDVRVVCNNTYTQALRAADGKKILRIPHLGDMETKLEDARAVLGLMHKQIDDRMDGMKQLAGIVMTQQAADRFLGQLFPLPVITDGMSKLDQVRVDMEITKVEAIRAEVQQLADSGRGVELFPAVRGTGYGWLNAVTEYTTHEMKRSDRSIGGQLVASATGEAARINSKAMSLLRSDLVAA